MRRGDYNGFILMASYLMASHKGIYLNGMEAAI